MSLQRILVLEDSNYRIDKFESLFIAQDLIITSNADMFINYLQQEPNPTYIYLDHDLDQMQYVDWETYDNTGMKVVNWIVANKPNWLYTIPIIVHSHNPSAATEMRNRLLAAGFICYLVPFWQIDGQAYRFDKKSALDENFKHGVQILDNVKQLLTDQYNALAKVIQ